MPLRCGAHHTCGRTHLKFGNTRLMCGPDRAWAATRGRRMTHTCCGRWRMSSSEMASTAPPSPVASPSRRHQDCCPPVRVATACVASRTKPAKRLGRPTSCKRTTHQAALNCIIVNADASIHGTHPHAVPPRRVVAHVHLGRPRARCGRVPHQARQGHGLSRRLRETCGWAAQYWPQTYLVEGANWAVVVAGEVQAPQCVPESPRRECAHGDSRLCSRERVAHPHSCTSDSCGGTKRRA